MKRRTHTPNYNHALRYEIKKTRPGALHKTRPAGTKLLRQAGMLPKLIGVTRRRLDGTIS